ncbi:MAG: S-methyl-5-thioribose-1-phosphate isomerase [Methylophaga sp.]|nr:S-methyl-5-thioribose-1-phosphate isomerase [Methylophaga sp.]
MDAAKQSLLFVIGVSVDKTKTSIQPVEWRDGRLCLLDQRRLPAETVWLTFDDANTVAHAIHDMVVRGAPAIGITAAYAVVLAARHAWNIAGVNWKQAMTAPIARLEASRPTAVNLKWALDKMSDLYLALPDEQVPEQQLLELAVQIHQSDVEANHQMGRLGAELIETGSQVMTHCNAGALATGGFGTALGVIRQGVAEGRIEHVHVNETRPWLQGARLTAWELLNEDIACSLNADVAAASLMASGRISWIIVGADRIAANGDVANKVGTYGLAILAKYHRIGFMVVAPTSTIDWQLCDGELIPIEQRSPAEVTQLAEKQIAPEGIDAVNPAFDITPASLIDVIVTEAGVVRQPSVETMKALQNGRNS